MTNSDQKQGLVILLQSVLVYPLHNQGGCYASQRVTYSSRDLFVMLTDGISEVPNERDEEFGLARLEQLLTEYAAQPLPHIAEGTRTRYGKEFTTKTVQNILSRLAAK